MPVRRSSVVWLAVVAVGVGVGTGVIGWAIGRSTAEEAATVTVTAGGEAGAQEEQPAGTTGMGREVYLNAGCSACHGLNAEGTDVGPSVAGHTAEQVHQQVRSPLAQMPAYSEAQLSEEDLDQVAGYLAGLEFMEEHAEPVKLSDVLAIHHWMAISAITAGDRGDALHHVGHIIERVKGEHLETMEKARALLREGDLHEAEHLIEEMLAGKAKPELTLAQLNLRLALTAVDQRDRAEAIHQIRHYLERVRGAEREKGEAVLAHLREGDLHGAEHGIADLLGLEGD